MAKQKTSFVCNLCGYESSKWMGKCPDCQSWNSLEEAIIRPASAPSSPLGFLGGNAPVALSSISLEGGARMDTGSEELNRVLGGGLVDNSTILLGGDPGIGKSTLLLQICAALSSKFTTLYITGEESATQIKLRAKRLDLSLSNMLLLCDTDLDNVLMQIEASKPRLVILDSIQTIFKSSIASAPGSITQVREATLELTRLAKKSGMAVIIVGHVTKDGSLAGPRVLEHLVDTVLYFEGDRNDALRIIRAVKNRFGSTNEIGIFEMSDKGMQPIENPSWLFLSERINSPGCSVMCAVEGTRPVMVQVQALVSASAFGNPRRMATGTDYNRMIMLSAVLEKKLNLRLCDQDIYVNIAGGMKVEERACDLAVAASIASSLLNKEVNDKVALMGEVGLTGEIRGINHCTRRINECAKMGFERVIIPKSNAKGLPKLDVDVIAVESLSQALELIFK